MLSNNTKWKSKKENLKTKNEPPPFPPKDTMISEFNVAEFDGSRPVEEDVDELILVNRRRDELSQPPSVPEEPEQPPGLKDQLADLTTNFSLLKAKNVFKSVVNSVPIALSGIHNSVSDTIVGSQYKTATANKSPDATKAKEIIKLQISRFVVIPMTYLVVLNWWYLWNYTNFNFQFDKITKIPPFSIFSHAIDPSLKILEFINYYLINIRMDADVSDNIREGLRTLWDWRPVTFTVFYILFSGGAMGLPFGKTFISIMSGDATILNGSIIVLSIIVFLHLTFTGGRWMTYMSYIPNPTVILFVVLLMVLFVILFATIGVSLFSMYLATLSTLSIFIFNYFNPFKIWSSISQIFTELKEAPTDDSDTTKSFVFKNFHGIVMIFMFYLPLFILHMKEAFTIKSADMVSLILFLNAIIFAIISVPYWGLIWNFVGMAIDFIKALFMDETIPVATEYSGSEPPTKTQ